MCAVKERQNEMGTDANIQTNHSVIYPEKEMQHKGLCALTEGFNVS